MNNLLLPVLCLDRDRSSGASEAEERDPQSRGESKLGAREREIASGEASVTWMRFGILTGPPYNSCAHTYKTEKNGSQVYEARKEAGCVGQHLLLHEFARVLFGWQSG